MSSIKPCSLLHKLDACRQGFTQKEEKRKLYMMSQQGGEPESHCRKRLKMNCDDSVSVSSASTSQPTSQSDELSAADGSVPSSATSSSLEWVYTNKPVYKYQTCAVERTFLFASSIIVFWGWTKNIQHQEVGDPFNRLAKSAQTLIIECAIEQGAHTFLAADWQVFENILTLVESIVQDDDLSPTVFSRRKPRTCIHVCRLGCGLGILRRAWLAWQERKENLKTPSSDGSGSRWKNGVRVPSDTGQLQSCHQQDIGRCKPLLHSLFTPTNDLPVAPHFIVTPLWLRACQRDNWRYELPHFEFFVPSPKDCSPGLFKSRSTGSLRILLLGFEYRKRMPPRDATSFTFWRTAVNCALGGKAWEESDLHSLPRQHEIVTSDDYYQAYCDLIRDTAQELKFRPFVSKHNPKGEYRVHNHPGYPDIVILYHGSRNVEDYVKNGNVLDAASRAGQMLLMHQAEIPMFSFTWLVDCYRSGTLCRKMDYLLNDELRLDDLLKRTCNALSEVISRDRDRRRDSTQACTTETEARDSWWMQQEFRLILEQQSGIAGSSLLSQALTAGTSALTQPLTTSAKPVLPANSCCGDVGLAFTHSTFNSHPGLPHACLATFSLADGPLVVGSLTFAVEFVVRETAGRLLYALQLPADDVTLWIDKLLSNTWEQIIDFVTTNTSEKCSMNSSETRASTLTRQLISIADECHVRAAAFHLISLLPITLHFGPDLKERNWAPTHPFKCAPPDVELTYVVQGDEYTSLAYNIQALCKLASFMVAYDFDNVIRPSVIKTGSFTAALLCTIFLDGLAALVAEILRVKFDGTASLEQYLELIIPMRTLVETAFSGRQMPIGQGLQIRRQARLEELKSFATDFKEIGQILYHRREYSMTSSAAEALDNLISWVGRRVCCDLHHQLTVLDTMSPWQWKKEGALRVLNELQKFPPPDASEETGKDNKYYAQLGYYDREDPMFFSSQAALPPLEFEIDFGERKSIRSKAEDAMHAIQSELEMQLNAIVHTYNTLRQECLMAGSGLEAETLRDRVLSLIVPN